MTLNMIGIKDLLYEIKNKKIKRFYVAFSFHKIPLCLYPHITPAVVNIAPAVVNIALATVNITPAEVSHNTYFRYL